MKNVLTIIFTLIGFAASAQVIASSQKSSSSTTAKVYNKVCAERGHNVIYSKTSSSPYTIDTKDSTVAVYPIAHASTGNCSRCGAEVESPDKEIRITTWRRVEKTPEPAAIAPVKIAAQSFNWGRNEHRSFNLPIRTASLDDIKKVATLVGDTLYIHKKVAPFTDIKEQVTATGLITIQYKDKPITFKTAVYDETDLYAGKRGLEIR